jgi:RecA-family ATPase
MPRDARPIQDIRVSAGIEGAFSAASLAGRAIPPREWAVDKLVPWRAVTLFSAHGGDGKSTLALQLGIAAATGRDWLGFPVKPCRVGIVSCEDDRGEIHRRLAAICRADEIDLAELTELDIFDRVGRPNAITTKDESTKWAWDTTVWFSFLMRWALDTGVRLLILDSLYDFFGGDQLNQTAASEFMGALRLLASEIDGAVMVLWHPSQSGRTSKEGTSGVNTFHNKARGRLFMERDETDTDIRIIRSPKQNYGPTEGEFLIRWQDGRFVRIEDDAIGLRSRKPKTVRLQAADKIALEALRDCIARQGEAAPASDHIPASARVVSVKIWRASALERSAFEDSPAGRKAWQRIKERLIAAGMIATWGEEVWTIT